MLRPLRIVRHACDTVEDLPARKETIKAPLSPGMPEGTHLFLISVARRYQRRGLSLAELVVAGEDGWQRARRYYGKDTDKFERWGFHWVPESMLMAVYQNETNTEPER